MRGVKWIHAQLESVRTTLERQVIYIILIKYSSRLTPDYFTYSQPEAYRIGTQAHPNPFAITRQAETTHERV